MKPRTPNPHPAKPESLKLRLLGLAAACAFAALGPAAEPIERRSAELAQVRVAAATESTATRPALAANERGDLALAPYYTVRDQWVTGLHIVNTSDRTQVVKVRFRRATDAMGALDFNLVMAPHDVYAGFLSRDVNGAIVWSSADTTCTVPAAQSQRLTMPAIYRADAETGHIEIIAMGTPKDERQPIALAARHAPAAAPARFGEPLDCAAVRSNFFADGAGTLSPNLKSRTLKKGVENQATTWQAPSAAALSPPNAAAAAIRAGGRNVYEDSGNVLKVSYFIRDNAAGIEFGDNAVHIRDFLARPAITNQQYSVLSGDLNGFSFPDLNGGVPRSSAPGAPGQAKPVKRTRFDALRAALGARAVLGGSGFGELNSAALGVEMDWVLTLPGQYLMLKLPQYVASLSGAGQAWAPTTASDGAPLDNPRCPRRATAAGCDYRDQPLRLAFEAYGPEPSQGQGASAARPDSASRRGLWSTLLDRFSGKPTRPPSLTSNSTMNSAMSPAPTPSPTSPRLSARVVLPKATNVISFGDDPAAGQRGVLGVSDAHVSATPPYAWLRARVKSADNDLRVCDWDFAHDLGAGFGAAAGAALNDTLRCSPVTHSDAPLIGFAAFRSRRVAANPAAAYGRIVEHSYERARASAEQGLALSKVAVNAASAAPMRRRFSAARPALAAPANLNLTWGDTQATASWTGVRGASRYTLYYSQSSLAGVDNPATASGVTRVADLTRASHTLTELSNDVTYYVVVTARNASGESAPSTQASVTPQAPTSAPAVPSGLRLSAGDAQVRAGWAATAGARTYTLYYSESSLADVANLSGLTAAQLAAAGITRVANLAGLAHTVTALTNDRRYFFAVAAANASGQSAASSQGSARPHAPATALAAPGDLDLVVGDARVTATWTEVPDARSYTLYYSRQRYTRERFSRMNAPPSAVYRSLPGGTRVTGLSGAAHTVTGLSNGATYYFVVTAENAAGEGASSAEVEVTPQAPTNAPNAPSVRLAAGNAQVTASWRLVDHARNYTLYYSESSLAGVTVTELATRDGVTRVPNLSGAEHTVTGLSNATPYYFVLTASNAIGESAASRQSSATPSSEAPATPAGLSLTAGNTRVTATWDEVSGASTYTLYYSAASLAGVSDFTTRSDVTRVANIAGAAHTVPYLANGSPYYFVVMAANAIGESPPSAQASATPRAPSAATAPEVFRDTLKDGGQGPEMVVLPAGYFRRGSPSDEVGRDSDEGPLRTVRLDRRLAMGRYEVTFADYDRFARAKAGVYRPKDQGWGRGMRPVINVSWNEAQVYAAWLSVQTGHTYRLPTEAEWEYAARAGTSTKYSFDPVGLVFCSQANYAGLHFFLSDSGLVTPCGVNRTLPIGGYAANPFGLYNMHGNVREWVEDCYSSDYSAAPSDGSAVRTGAGGAACNSRVVRGGGWDSYVNTGVYFGAEQDQLRSAARKSTQPVTRYGNNGGFRLVREVTTVAPAAPGSPSLAAGSTRVTATWPATRDASRYTLYYSESSFAGASDLTAAGITRVANITATSHTVTGLSNGTTYYFRVTASNAGGESAASSELSATPQVPAPGAPSAPSLTPGNEQVAASWTAVSGASRYTLYYSQSSISDVTASEVTPVPNLTATSHTVRGLTNGTTYYFVVRASNAGGDSAASSESSATPQVPTPGVPSGLSLEAGNAQVAASWTAVSGASRYTLYYSQSSFTDVTASEVTALENLTATSRTVTGLTNGSRYYFRVTATNAGGESAASGEVSAMPQVPAPGVPSGLKLEAGDKQVAATWTAVSDATGYKLYYSSTPNLANDLKRSDITSVPVTGTSHTVSGLTNGTIYYFVLAATNAGGESAVSGEVSATPQVAAPDTPRELKLTAGNAQVMATWTASSRATSYTLYYSQSSITDINDASSVTAVANITGTSHTVRELSNGTEYYFVVTASNPGGPSAVSNQPSATPLAPPGAPSGLSLTAGNGQVAASWTAGTGVSSNYTLYYATSSFGEITDPATKTGVVTVANLTATSHTVSPLTNATTYYFVVRASNVGGQSGVSNEASATPQDPPDTPTGLSLSAGNGRVTANWTASSRAASYTLYYSQSSITDISASGVTKLQIPSGTSRTVTGLINGRRYYFRVRAVNVGGESAVSTEDSATPLAPPGTPSGLSLTAGDARVAASWTAGTGTTTSYTLYYSQSRITDVAASGVTAVPNIPVTRREVIGAGVFFLGFRTQTGLTNGTTYYFRVTGSNVGGESAASGEVSATPQAPPDTPTGLSLTAGDTQVTASWTASSRAASYTLYYSQSSITDIKAAGVTAVEVTTGTSHTVTGLTNGTLYYFKVTASNVGGESAVSTESSATPLAPPGAPSGLNLNAGNAQVTANWTAGTGVSSTYTLYYSQSPITGLTAAGVTAVPNLTATSRNVTGLTNGRRYYFKVTASNNAGGQGAASAQAFANPQLPFEDSLQSSTQSGPEMVALPTGSFSMGSPSTEAGRSTDEGPVRTVTISRRIAMSRHEVTFADYDRFADAVSGRSRPSDQTWGRSTRPVINVGRADAKAYATWLSTQTGKTYRLPTEAEWEYAARAGTTTRYSWGDEIGNNRANCNGCKGSTSVTRTDAVGSFAANAFGLFDMHGNVWEWVEDCHGSYNDAGVPSDGSARTSGCSATAAARTLGRGGSWSNSPNSVRSATRSSCTPSGTCRSYTSTHGIRLVQDLSPFAPTSLSLSAGNTQVTASWARADGASKYTLYYSQSSLAGVADLTELTATELTTAGITRVEDITGASHTVSGLTNGTLYYFVVTASNAADGESGASSEASATPQSTAVATPGNLTLTAGNAQVTASWTAMTGASGYTLYRSTSPITSLTSGVTSVEVAGASHTVTGLTNGTRYYFVVVSKYTGGSSAASSQESATPQIPAPTGLRLIPGNRQVTVNWTAVTNASGYNLYYSRSPDVNSRSGDLATLRNAETTVTRVADITGASSTVTGLTNGATYYFIVKAKNAIGGEGPASSELPATPRIPAPTNLNLIAGNRQVTASWDAVTHASGYNLYYSTSANIATDTSRATRVEVTGTSRLLISLTNGTRYYVIVKAKNASGGEGPASGERSATPATPTRTPTTSAFEDSLLSGGKAPRMVVVPAGNFTRGSRNDDTTGEANERPSHNVTFDKSFAIGQYEVSFADWDRYVASQGSGAYRPGDGAGGRGKQPVVLVSWNDVTTATTGYLAWLSRQTGNTYRLPTEAEWEYATRAGTTTAYHFGNNINCNQANWGRNTTTTTAGLSRECNPGIRNPDGSTTYTAQSPEDVDTGYTSNAWGLFHVHGNVSEFVQDCYVANYRGAFRDGRARTICPGTTNKVLRGGSWIYSKAYQRSAKRDGIPTGDSGRSNTVGFRVAQDLN